MVGNEVPDDTATELKTTTNDQTIGDYAFNATLQGISIAVSDGHKLKAVEVIDQTGGVIWKAFGGTRMPTAGATSQEYNFEALDINIPILKGYSLKVTTAEN